MSDLRVALTFDAEHPSRAGNSPGTDAAILDALSDAGVAATFFLQGRWTSAHPDVARRIVGDGHLVGSHSHYHAPMTLLSTEGIAIDVREAQSRIMDVTGRDPRPWFRCPFGDGSDTPGVLSALDAAGYHDVGWNVDSNDWCAPTPDDVRAAVVGPALAAASPAVALFHTWPSATAAALPSIIEQLRAEGASFVTAADVVEGRA
jgi:peptidoglycan/xylan/chitin deacetylase (PgdA/CDA1 family)